MPQITVCTYHELVFLLMCLEASVTELTGRVDELELHFLHGTAASLSQQRLVTSQNHTQKLVTSLHRLVSDIIRTPRLMTSQHHREL